MGTDGSAPIPSDNTSTTFCLSCSFTDLKRKWMRAPRDGSRVLPCPGRAASGLRTCGSQCGTEGPGNPGPRGHLVECKAGFKKFHSFTCSTGLQPGASAWHPKNQRGPALASPLRPRTVPEELAAPEKGRRVEHRGPTPKRGLQKLQEAQKATQQVPRPRAPSRSQPANSAGRAGLGRKESEKCAKAP